MTTYLVFFLSFFMGYLVIALFLRKSPPVLPLLHFFLSVGLGLGISSLLTFFSFFVCNGFNSIFIFSVNLLVFFALIFIHMKLKVFHFPSLKFRFLKLSYIASALFFLIVSMVTYTMAKGHPFGEWDAWAIWNMKAKFLTLSGHSWKDIFHALHWHTQPDYPLLLPFMNIWGWVFSKDFFRVPLLTAVLLTISCVGLLFSGLLQCQRKATAFLAACLLFSLPSYAIRGTQQYADILLAYYLLASFITFAVAFREKDRGFAILYGIFLGLLAFTKNEGIIISLLLMALTVIYLFLENSNTRGVRWNIIAPILLGVCITGPWALIFKLLLAPLNQDIFVQNQVGSLSYFNFEGCYMVLSALFQELTGITWGYIWVVIFLAVVLRWKGYFDKELKVFSLFFICYFFIVFLIYLLTVHFNLMWRLSRTLPRILFYLLPSILFLVFYTHDLKTDAKK